MALSVNVTLDDGDSHTVTLPGPIPGSRMVKRVLGATGRSAGGTRYAYKKGVTVYETELEFVTLSDTDKNNLDTFFETHIEGMTNTWTYTDTGGNTYTARFLDPELEYEKVAQGCWSVTMRLELNTMGK